MILIDGNPVLYRAWFVNELTTSKGDPSGMVYGTLKILASLFRRFQGEAVTVFWDLGKSAYRMEKYPEYKQTEGRKTSRTKPGYPEDSFGRQSVAVKTILESLGIRQVQVQGVEADDLIAISTTTGIGPYTVVADDLDMYQLISDGLVRVYGPRKDIWISSREQCRAETGLFPEQILDYKALSGDPSDNIPGVPSVGEKTAKSILSVCGSIPELYRRIRAGERLPVGKAVEAKLVEHEDKAKLWYDLCQPLTWDMLSLTQQAEYLQGWTAVQGPVDLPDLIQSLEAWELREFLSDVRGFVRLFRPEFDGPAEPTVMPASGPEVAPVQPRPFEPFKEIHERVLACDACPLRKECTLPVPGNIDNKTHMPTIMVVGRNPGQNEDRLGRGFVGRSGQRLDRLLEGKDDSGSLVHKGALLDRRDLWISNVVKCFSVGNRPPTEQEWVTCANRHLREEIRVIQPRLILSFGSEAMAALTGHDDSIMKRAGSVVTGSESNGIIQYTLTDGERSWDPILNPECQILLFPHPSAALRTRAVEVRFQQCGHILEGVLEEMK